MGGDQIAREKPHVFFYGLREGEEGRGEYRGWRNQDRLMREN